MIIERFDMAHPLNGDASRAADVLAISRLWAQNPDFEPQDLEEHRRLLAGLEYLVARDESQAVVGTVSIVGYGMPVATIDSLAVAPGHQRKGIGLELAVSAVEHCFDHPTFAIITNSLPAARPLFEKIGFETDEVDPDTNATMYLHR